jgi:hypothetical protein
MRLLTGVSYNPSTALRHHPNPVKARLFQILLQDEPIQSAGITPPHVANLEPLQQQLPILARAGGESLGAIVLSILPGFHK